MHPIERLRYVARADGAPASELAAEAAGALAAIAGDPAALVMGCRRLIDRHPTVAPLWWLGARVLSAIDPAREAWSAAGELDDDPTGRVLARTIPESARVVVIASPATTLRALSRRRDLSVLVVDVLDEGQGAMRRLRSKGVDAEYVPGFGLGSAAADADLVLVEAEGVGPSGALAAAGAHAAAAVARSRSCPAWLVAGTGRVLPGRLWDALLDRLGGDEPWQRDVELTPLDLFDLVVGPTGAVAAAEAPGRADCPIAPELLRGPGARFSA